MSNELKLRDEWMAEARDMTMAKLPAFLEKLAAHNHDYGTICRAIAAAGVAAAWAMERSPQGGITGFQASCVTWDLITGWDQSYEGKPLRIVNFEDMLYPQHSERFLTISDSSWGWLQEKARENLKAHSDAHPNVVAHWESISTGKVPFGYRVNG